MTDGTASLIYHAVEGRSSAVARGCPWRLGVASGESMFPDVANLASHHDRTTVIA